MKREDLLQQVIDNLHNMYRGMLQKSDHQKTGIPFGQKAVLFTIAGRGLINVKELAAILHITSGATTQHVDALMKDGLVERTIDPQDRRNVIITLSSHGKKTIQKLKHSRMLMVKELFGDVTDEELEIYNNVFEKVNNRIKQHG